MPFDTEFWSQLLGDIVSKVMVWLPSLVGALVLLLGGWVAARLIQLFLAALLRRLGVDKLSERAGIAQLLANANLDSSLVKLISRLIYWLVLLFFVVAAAESLGLGSVVTMLNGLVSYLPNVLAAALILLLGSLIARLVGEGLGVLATQAGIATGPLLGRGARYALLVFVVILAMEQLGIKTTLLSTVVTALLAATALALALAFGMGSRDLARNIMAGFHAKDAFGIGQTLRVGAHTGRLVEIGAVKTVLETESGLVSLPNATLIEEEVIVLTGGGAPA